MKKLINFRKAMKLFFISFLFISYFNVSAQNIISREESNYLPEGIVPESPVPCADYTELTDLDCIIYLKPANLGVDYSDIVHLQGTYTWSGLDYYNAQVDGNCSSGIFNFNEGIITMAGADICIPNTGESYIQFDLELGQGAEMDMQRFRIPILSTRDPNKVVLVLDRSGSMDWSVPGGTAIRWNVLKKSVWEFVAQLELEQADGDEIGLTYFHYVVLQPGSPIGNSFAPITAHDAPPLISDEINTLMNAQNPQGATAMGSGLKDAKTKLQGNTPLGVKKIVLLFTDGEQNQYPEVLLDGRTLQDGSLLNDGPVPKKDSIKYYTIGMGSSAMVPPILSAIASANSGMFLYTITGDHSDFQQFFDNHFVDMLSGSSPQIVNRQVGKLVNGVGSHSFVLNEGISHAIFKVSFKDGDNINFTIEKGGDDYTPENIIASSFVKMTKVEFPIINNNVIKSGGEWTVKITGDSNDEYYVTCIADDHFLDYSGKTDKARYISGEYIDFIADFSYAGAPFIDNNDSVKVIVFKPGDDLGHLLATYSLPENEIDYTDEDLSPEEQKFQALMSDENFYNKLLPNEQIIKLQHLGNGIYKGRFEVTDISGVYQALFRFKGNIATLGDFNREKLLSIIVENGNFISENIGQLNDDTSPSLPTNLIASNITDVAIDLSWEASIDNVKVKDYSVYQNSTLVGNTSNTSYQFSGLNFSTEYSFYIIANDYANNSSSQTEELSITTLREPDSESPTTPTNLLAADITQTNLNLSWEASTDNFDVTGYAIYKNDNPIANTISTSYLVTDLEPGSNYSFSVAAYDEATNESGQSEAINTTTLNVPQTLTAPTKLVPSDITQTSLSLNWNASNGGIAYVEYQIYKDGSLIGTTSNVTYNLSNLEASTEYSFQVMAKDSKDNISEASNTAITTTLDEVKDVENGYSILTIRPKNKFGYYLGPGFKRKIRFKYLPKVPRDPVAHKTSIEDEAQEESTPEPYLKDIKDNLDGSYYLIVANVLPKTNPNILISIGEEVYFEGPINGKIPIWFYIIIILILIILIILWLTKSKNKILRTILWVILILLIAILYLHKTGFLNFL